MNEATHKTKLVKKGRTLHPGYIFLRHEDLWTSGIPDISITGNKRTVWIEVKFADPDFESKGNQDLTMLRLSISGLAYYVIFVDDETGQSVRIVSPSDYQHWRTKGISILGFDYEWVLKFIARILTYGV
jgi:hypothetical protein